MTDRAKRRDQKERAKHRVKAYDICKGQTNNPRRIGQFARTPKPCSCHMCGNPRTWRNKLTPQEYLQDSKELTDY